MATFSFSKIIIVQILVLFFSNFLFAMGFNVDITSINFTPTESSDASTISSNVGTTTIAYTLGGKGRTLTDDDGLASLFLVHRNAVQRIFSREWTLDTPLEKPYTAIFRSLEMLEATYREVGQSSGNSLYTANADRIKGIADNLRSKNPIKVSDLQSSGLEDLINDSLSTHTYNVDREGESSVRSRLDEVFLVDIPDSFSATMAPRCRDNPVLNWRNAVRGFTASAPSSGSTDAVDSNATN